MESDLKWFKPIPLDFDAASDDDEKFLKSLRRQMRLGLQEQGVSENEIKRCVYIVRMTGSFIIAYHRSNSPVLYIGRGDAKKRIASHFGKWLSDDCDFGNDSHAEIRLVIPRRQKRENYYKNVEADLNLNFKEQNGSLPYFNRRLEKRFSKKVQYTAAQEKLLRRFIGIGSGKRPWWAIRPTCANPSRETYLRGVDSSN
jgi:hypothetical protein